jgi:hypothetical protein
MCGTFSDERMDSLELTLGLASAVFLAGLMTIFYYIKFETLLTWRARFRTVMAAGALC